LTSEFRVEQADDQEWASSLNAPGRARAGQAVSTLWT